MSAASILWELLAIKENGELLWKGWSAAGQTRDMHDFMSVLRWEAINLRDQVRLIVQ